jgi:hypothetical protein
MIQKRIDLLKPYFRGIKLAENYRIVEINFKKVWDIVNDTDEISVQQKELKDNPKMIYTMFYSENKTFDEILDFVEEVVNYNLELEQKESLLKAKVEELKKVFETKSLDELNNLKFTTNEDTLKLNGIKVGVNGLGTANNNNTINATENGSTKELSTNSQSN